MKLLTDKEHIKFFIRTIVCILIGSLIISTAQLYMSLIDYKNASDDFLENVTSSLSERSDLLEEINDYNDTVNKELAFNLLYLYSSLAYDNLSKDEMEQKLWQFSDLLEQSGVDELYVADYDGNVDFACRYVIYTNDSEPIFSCEFGDNEENLIENGTFTAEQLQKITNDLEEKGESQFEVARDNSTVCYQCEAVLGIDDSEPRMFIVGDDKELNETLLSNLGRLDSYFDTIVSYDAIRAFAVDKKTDEIIYASDNISEYLGTKASDHGLDFTNTSKYGESIKVTVDGDDTTVMLKEFRSPEIGTIILGTMPSTDNKEMSLAVVIISLIMAVIVLFIFSIGTSLQGVGKKVMIKKMVAISILGVILMAGASFYVRTLYDISQAMQQGIQNARVFEKNLKDNAALADAVENYYENKQISIQKAVRSCFERNWDIVFEYANPDTTYTYYTKNKDGLRESVNDSYGNPLKSVAGNYILGNMISATEDEQIYVINHDGLTIATNTQNWYYGLQSDADYCMEMEESDSINEVLERRSPYYYSRTSSDEDNTVRVVIGMPVDLYTFLDENGNTVYRNSADYESMPEETKKEYGLLLLVKEESDSFFLDENITSTSSLEAMRASEGASLCVLSGKEDHDVIYKTDDIKKRYLSDLDFTDEDFEGDNYKFIKLNNTKYFASLVKLTDSGSDSLLTLLKKDSIFFGRIEVSIVSTVCVAIILFMMTLYLVKKEPENETQSRYNRDGIIEIARLVAGVVALVLVIFAVEVRGMGDDTTAFAYGVSRRWTKGVHIFSVSYVAYLLLVISMSVLTAKRIMRMIASSLSSQAETVARLFISIMQYAGIIVMIFYSMYLFGVQTGTVITSAGIMTIVVGLGANSLIGDIIAGLFIIIEREYKVDDIVTIDNYTGVVKEIGLRTTKVLDSNGNLKTFNNSKINGVINLTDNYSKTFITTSISQDYDVSFVEEFINVDLKKRMEGNKKIINGPWFSGITDIKGGNYTISIGVRCRQQDQWTVRKDVYANLMEVAKEKGVKLS